MELVGFWKMLVNKFYKNFSNVCFYVHAVWWVKPYYLSLSYFVWRCQMLLINKIFFLRTRRQCVVIGRCSIIKCCFIRWNIAYSLWNAIWQCLDDIRRMVWVDIDINRCVVRFVIRLVFSSAKVECNIQEINCFYICCDSYFQAGVLPETYVLNSIYFPKKK